MSSVPICFLDTETTGLDAARHEVWEVAIIRREPGRRDGQTWSCLISDVDLRTADPFALKVGRFYDRHPRYNGRERESQFVMDKHAAAARIFDLTRDAYLAGINPSFDERFLRELLLEFGHQPTWSHHKIDALPLAAGHLKIAPPWKSDEVMARLGVRIDEHRRHTALGDAQLSMFAYDTIFR